MMTNWRPEGWTNLFSDNEPKTRFLRVGTLQTTMTDYELFEAGADAMLEALMRGECLSGELVAEMAINRYGFSTPIKNRKGTWVFIPDKEGE